MKRNRLPLIVLLALLAGTLAGGTDLYAAEAKGTKPPKSELLTRIDFGNSYINGQTLKSGSVYLLQRKKNNVKSMLTLRENYRKEILEAHNLNAPTPGVSEGKGPVSQD